MACNRIAGRVSLFDAELELKSGADGVESLSSAQEAAFDVVYRRFMIRRIDFLQTLRAY